MIIDLIEISIALIVIWYATGVVVISINKIAHKLNISAFATSFFLLGFLTSLPEISVGINSIIDNTPEVMIGDLIGGSLVLFALIVPVLAILGNGVKLNHSMSGGKILYALCVIGLPSLFIVDGKLIPAEALILLLAYAVLFYIIEKRKGVLDHIKDKLKDGKHNPKKEIAKTVVASTAVFFASRVLVHKAIYFSEIFGVSPFVMGLLGLSIGTNFPEITLTIRSIFSKKKDIALGDYIGSAAANTFIMGFLAIIFGYPIYVANHLFLTMLFTFFGLGLFYFFTRSKSDISRTEGLIMIFVYFIFFILEVI